MLYAYFQLRDMFTAVWPCAMIDERWLCWQRRHGEVATVTLPGKAINLESYIRMMGTELGSDPTGREELRLRSRKWPKNGFLVHPAGLRYLVPQAHQNIVQTTVC